MSAQKPVRLSVNMNRETADALRDISETHGITVTEAVRRVISLAKFMDDETRKGNLIIVEQKDGSRRELVIK